MHQDLLELERLIDRGETAAALPILKQAVSRDPGHAAVRLLLARALEGEGRHDEAVAAWRMVRTLVPDSPTAVSGLKRALRQRVLASTPPDAWEIALSDVEPRAMDGSPSTVDSGLPAPPEPGEAPDADPGEPGWEDVLEDVESVAWRPPETTATDADPTTPVDPGPPDVPPGEDEVQNLDELIRELESARIVPDPSIPPAAAEDLESDVDDVVSETLARIYENQRHFDEAARVYDTLAAQQPDRASEFRQKASEARERAGS